MRVSVRLASVLKITAGALVLVLIVLLGTAVYLYRLSSTLPDISAGEDVFESAQTSVVYASDGSVLSEWHGEEDRTVVALEEIPQHMRDAVIAIEDERFYSHNGVDARAIMRAFRANSESGGVTQGGSTITQQLVKLYYTDGERTFTRKVKEALLAYELEARADKSDVLETYLNTVYFGQGSYGVESASEKFFGHPVSELTLDEAALLAGLIRSPARYSPIEHPDQALTRRDLVLRMMREQEHITSAEENEARDTTLAVAPPSEVADVAPYFVEYVRQTLIDQLGADEVYRGGLQVRTTLDPKLQKLAEQAAWGLLAGPDDPEVALVAVDHRTGHIVAMVGGRDFNTNQFNLAAQARRQPGSAFKPFVLVRALEEGIRPEQTYSASPYTVQVKDGTWKVENYEDQYAAATLTLRAATTWSVNAVFARLMMQVGAADVVETAKKMGIESPLEPNPAIALGGLSQGVTPLEMASAYGTIASKGMRVDPVGIALVTDAEGETLLEAEVAPERVLNEAVAVQASLMLHDVVQTGTGTSANIPGVWVAGKTGTTQEYRDAWFVGFAEDLSCAVWVGYPESQVEMTDVNGVRVTGGSYPAQIWKRFMTGAVAYQRKPVTPVAGGQVEPAPVPGAAAEPVLTSICPDSMQLANKRCPSPVEIYLDPALVPKEACSKH